MTVSLAALLFVTAVAVPIITALLLLSSAKKGRPGPADGCRRLPPSPPGLPLIGHLHLLGRLPHRALRSLAASHGPVMLLRLGRVPTVVASSSAAAEEAMKTRDLAFSGRPGLLMAQSLLYGGRDVGFAPYGEYWRQARRVSPRSSPACAALVARVRRDAAADGEANLSDALICYSNAIISRAAFGDGDYRLDGDQGGEKLRQVVADFQELVLASPMREISPWLGWVDTLTGLESKTRCTFEALDGLLERVIADHRNRRSSGRHAVLGDGAEVADDHRDFVDVLLDVNEMDEEAGFQLETDNIKAIIMDVFAAGTDTSSTVLGWAMAELINHPHEMRKLQAEVRAAAGGAITEDHLDGMPYLKAVISETMRLHAPAALLIPRETTEDTELLGYHIPARTRVVINAWAIGRDPAAWERAEEFVPERWFAAGDALLDYSKVGQDFRSVPFGAGRRGCPGAGFAAPTMELALANMLYHFDWALPHGTGAGGDVLGTPALVDVSEVFGLSVRLKEPLILVAKPWSG
ncbi:unnamed protein product [Urochloa decumbens]|uniref:Uncharacterized protein n=1 Tax=Urochloa decumbens TaxID=240449 RepID=A0ABC8ZUK6_9POAL